jgi:hypothetical protein
MIKTAAGLRNRGPAFGFGGMQSNKWMIFVKINEQFYENIK